jgi:uncharacterized protein (DUF433 family)
VVEGLTKIQNHLEIFRIMDIKKLIEINPDVMLGKPVIKGTRITVELVVRKLGEGSTIGNLLEGHPNLSKEAVHAALIYAAAAVADEQFIYFKTGTGN